MEEIYEYGFIPGGMQKNIGGYIDGTNINKLNISPEILFQIDLKKSFDFLEEFITEEEYNQILNIIEKFNFHVFKNPALILISYIIFKNNKGPELTPVILRYYYNHQNITPLIKINNISQPDIIRYYRFFELHLKQLISRNN